LDPLDRLQVFQDHIRELEREENEKVKQEKHDLRCKSRLSRESFRALLMDKWVAGEINVKTKWNDFGKIIKNEERYIALLDASGNDSSSTPAELFYDFIDDLEERYQKDKKRVKEMMKDKGITPTPSMSYQQFCETLSSHDKFSVVDSSNLKILFEETLEKAKKTEERKKKKQLKNFKSDLKNNKDLENSSTWEEFKNKVGTQYDLLTDEEKEKCFLDIVRDLTPYDSTDEEGTIKEKRKDRKSREKKHRRHSASESYGRAKRKRSWSPADDRDKKAPDRDAKDKDTDERAAKRKREIKEYPELEMGELPPEEY